jgi:antitoxin ChpS
VVCPGGTWIILIYNYRADKMHTTNLRKVGGSVMLAVPPALLNVLRLEAGATVGLAIESGRLVVEPRSKPRYSLDELLSQCGSGRGRSKAALAWVRGRRAGGELI